LWVVVPCSPVVAYKPVSAASPLPVPWFWLNNLPGPILYLTNTSHEFPSPPQFNNEDGDCRVSSRPLSNSYHRENLNSEINKFFSISVQAPWTKLYGSRQYVRATGPAYHVHTSTIWGDQKALEMSGHGSTSQPVSSVTVFVIYVGRMKSRALSPWTSPLLANVLSHVTLTAGRQSPVTFCKFTRITFISTFSAGEIAWFHCIVIVSRHRHRRLSSYPAGSFAQSHEVWQPSGGGSVPYGPCMAHACNSV
jgi:hypothetical protein